MRAIVIEIPDGIEPEDMSNPVSWVALGLTRGETSGKFGDPEIRWSVEDMD